MHSNVSRRDFLEAGVVASIAHLLPGPLPHAEPAGPAGSSLPLITKTIPSSGERIPAIGIGTDSFRDRVSEEIRAELKRMSELGGSVIDTAAAYGDSEALIGQALESLGTREKMFIATKLVGGASSSSSTPAGTDSFERSLERLKTPRVELLQVH